MLDILFSTFAGLMLSLLVVMWVDDSSTEGDVYHIQTNQINR